MIKIKSKGKTHTIKSITPKKPKDSIDNTTFVTETLPGYVTYKNIVRYPEEVVPMTKLNEFRKISTQADEDVMINDIKYVDNKDSFKPSTSLINIEEIDKTFDALKMDDLDLEDEDDVNEDEVTPTWWQNLRAEQQTEEVKPTLIIDGEGIKEVAVEKAYVAPPLPTVNLEPLLETETKEEEVEEVEEVEVSEIIAEEDVEKQEEPEVAVEEEEVQVEPEVTAKEEIIENEEPLEESEIVIEDNREFEIQNLLNEIQSETVEEVPSEQKEVEERKATHHVLKAPVTPQRRLGLTAWIESLFRREPKSGKKPKLQKGLPKEPKQVKEKAPKAPKAPKALKAPKAPKAPKTPRPTGGLPKPSGGKINIKTTPNPKAPRAPKGKVNIPQSPQKESPIDNLLNSETYGLGSGVINKNEKVDK